MSENVENEKIDLRGVLCPINFVKTKLKLEMMESDQVLEVTLDDGEPMRNVPRSVKEDGHKIVKVEPFEDGFKIHIKKS
ncbi:MAG: sulfurtransferase TusA family protein [Planctomycetes bacterium]|nr:sulfurtransferase TusA family protein [Planctomycetota bacterium]